MIASLPMYWRPENAGLWMAFWAHVREALLDLPPLTPPEDIPAPWTRHWLRPDLALSSTCSLPFRATLRDRVTYVGTLDHSVSDRPGHYLSKIIRNPRAQAPARRLAVNEPDSHSGWGVAQGHPLIAEVNEVITTGAHAQSLAAVADGRADLAFIDAITWRVLEAFDPNTAKVDVVGETAPSPGHALITAKGNDPKPLRAAIAQATERFAPEFPHHMGGPIRFHVLDEAAYFALPIPAPPAG